MGTPRARHANTRRPSAALLAGLSALAVAASVAGCASGRALAGSATSTVASAAPASSGVPVSSAGPASPIASMSSPVNQAAIDPQGGDVGDVTIDPHVPDPNSCSTLFHAGEVIDLAAEGFTPDAAVTVQFTPTTRGLATQLVKADQNGEIELTVTLPSAFKGMSAPALGEHPVEFVNAFEGSDSNEGDITIISVGKADADCGVTPQPASNIQLAVEGSESPYNPTTGAVFAVTGPGLPAVGASVVPGTFAELDEDSGESGVCPATEPHGVICVRGALGNLMPNAIYTVTEVTVPHDFTGAPPQTFRALADDYVFLRFYNTYIGPPPPANATVVLNTSDYSLPTGIATFALTGPGAPNLTSATPAPGTFTELDVVYPGETNCPSSEPSAITCDDGLLQGLTPGASYTFTQLTAPTGYAIAPPQTLVAPSDGSNGWVTFVDNPS